DHPRPDTGEPIWPVAVFRHLAILKGGMSEANDDIRGRGAEWPSQIPRSGWRDILWRLLARFNEDRVMLIAAGATFYLLLSLFPALAAFVSVYGFFADATTIAGHLSVLAG